MSEHDTANDSAARDAGEQSPEPLLDTLASTLPFGPMFFLEQLHAFVRDRCPNPDEHLPAVEVHLADGEVLDVCHVMGLAPLWVALAVNDTERTAHEPSPMRTELVPYQIVSRVTIRSTRKELAHLGFDLNKKPPVWTANRGHFSPEEALRAAAHTRSSSRCSNHEK